jgi:OmcA/MtrC family decaheme c-type cytochrome
MIRNQHGSFVIRGMVFLLALSCLAVALQASSDGKKEPGAFTKHDLAYYLDEASAAFIRPGLILQITGVQIGPDNRAVVVFKITDPKGMPLDRDGIMTPGPVSTSFVLARIPKEKQGTAPFVSQQYVAYTTRVAKDPTTGVTAVQASADSGGTYTKLSDGVYSYVFKTAVPANYDQTATHTVSLYGRRDLSEFGLGSEYGYSTEFNWVPNGSPVVDVRDVVRTDTCNKCHDPLSAHGGSRRTVPTCVTCHTPQSVNPGSGNTVDMKVMIHKIHDGPNLPSVQAGKPYQIISVRGGVTDFSNITFPDLDGVQNCQHCHDGSATQSANWYLNPTAATCGSCHDDVNFATGDKHPGGPQPTDHFCATCHIPQGDLEFDASIKGAHTIPRFSKDLPGVVFQITDVKNTAPGQNPTVTLKVTDKSGFPIETSQMSSLSLVIAGPTTDYAQVWSESLLKTASTNGVVAYTFTKPIPADAKGSFTVGVEGYRMVTLQPGTTNEHKNVRDVGFNVIQTFAVTDQAPVARRLVISQDNCNTCHGSIALHGTIRQNVQYCQLCHNANADDKPFRKPADYPTESIHFKTMVHKIHTGENLETNFTIIGYQGSVINFNDVTYPGDRRNCQKCHVDDSNQIPLPDGVLPSVAPRDYINPEQPTTAACLSCHTGKDAASHALINISTLGESCTVCHGQTSEFSIDKVHAR